MLTKLQREWLKEHLKANLDTISVPLDTESVETKSEAFTKRATELFNGAVLVGTQLETYQYKVGKTARDTYDEAESKFRKSIKQEEEEVAVSKNYKQGLKNLKTFESEYEKAVAALIKAGNNQAKIEFEKNQDKTDQIIIDADKFIEEQKYKVGTHVVGQAVKGYLEVKDTYQQAAKVEGYMDANRERSNLELAAGLLKTQHAELEKERVAIVARRDALKLQTDRLDKAIDNGEYDDFEDAVKVYQAAKVTAKNAFDNALAIHDVPVAAAALKQLEQDITDSVSKAIAGKLMADDTGASNKGTYKVALDWLEKDPLVLRSLVQQPNGGEYLDKLVGGLGTKVSGDQQSFITKAIEARFGLAAGGMSGKFGKNTQALPKIYKLLWMVPDSHTLTNESLKTIKREKKGGASFYAAGSQEIVLKLKRPGDSKQDFDHDDDVDVANQLKPGKVTYFDHTTLHEIGHSVDDMDTFMKGNEDAQYGGWKEHSDIGDIVKTVYDNKPFNDKWKSKNTEAALRDFLKKVLEGGQPEGAAVGLKNDQDAALSKSDLKELLKEKPVAWCLAVRLKNEDSGLWDQGKKAVVQQIGNRVYQESYKGKWVSYDVAARQHGVTSYQFRAPGEWFAELYATFYLDKLKTSHTDFDWISKKYPKGKDPATFPKKKAK